MITEAAVALAAIAAATGLAIAGSVDGAAALGLIGTVAGVVLRGRFGKPAR